MKIFEKKENHYKTDKLTKMSHEIEEMRNVLGKLTEVRVILNKHFSLKYGEFYR